MMEGVARFAEGLEAYRGGAWGKARVDFQACRAALPDDKPSAVFLARIEKLEANPPAEWNGIWTLSEK
jgi:adenylate cyclase